MHPQHEPLHTRNSGASHFPVVANGKSRTWGLRGDCHAWRLASIIATLFTLLFTILLAIQPAPALAQEPVTPPSATPDAAAGLEIFAQRCANCHGPLGMGDGEQAAQLPVPPAALGSVDYVRQAVPAHMFDVITNGVVQGGMPPFGPGNSDPLSETDRWNLVAAVYSLGQRQGLIDEGQIQYEASCQECHAVDGSGGDGVPDLRDQTLWLQRSDQDVHRRLAVEPIPEHEQIDLEEEALWAAIGFARTFSYDYADPMAAFEPIEAATVTGSVTNESTGEPLQEGVPAILNAFTADFQPSLTMTTTLDAGGQFQFDLTMVPPDLVYVVTVQYDDISYGSDFGRLQRDEPTLNLAVPVYERSDDPSTVSIDQLHIILQFAEGQVQVSELYQFSQNAPTVFVGQSGDPAAGTVRVALPDAASDPSFDRTFGGMESFFPADTVIPVDDGWADTVPLRPGPSSLSLLVRYTLPYDQDLTLSHPLHYPVSRANLVMPDVGVGFGGDAWQEGEPQAMGNAGIFLNYTQTSVPADQPIQFSLQGEPDLTATSAAAAPAARNSTNELLIGGGVLLLALAAGMYTIRVWRQNQEPDAEWLDAPGDMASGDAPRPETPAPAVAPEAASPGAQRRQELLQAIAALDDAHEAGDVSESDYEARRQALKDELIAIWDA